MAKLNVAIIWKTAHRRERKTGIMGLGSRAASRLSLYSLCCTFQLYCSKSFWDHSIGAQVYDYSEQTFDLTLNDLKGQVQGHSNCKCVYLLNEVS